ncbi:sugar ABC transporter substrate-binding protein [Nocardioides jejuensis]|uniref:Sugar ABC transporter substrate-binding protein n=1 Tax=Nocardioides jejuensis TaxID=2502782 RepID=A0A4R1CIX0_9ACTN|nr:substrate-binding domain-containing protein [Nocardioides jejuensis]TCJ31209.1 sugar ABC transporter substrate-binding protein [Nocardioides jejuensis]
MAAPITRGVVLGAALLFGATSFTACAANDAQNGGSKKDGGTIALLLPESKTTRYEAFDKPLFEAKVASLCSDCTVDYYNADQDEAKQAQQMETAISKGAKVVVLDPVNGAGAGAMVKSAQTSGAKVVAYDRFIGSADYYLSFDNETVGKMQATALVDAMGGKGNILMTNGAPSDPNAAQFKAGAHSVIDKASGVKVLAEYDNPDWSPDKAQRWVTDQLSKFPANTIQGVYAANDGQAGGVVAALTGAGVKADALPPITGQDAELAAIQRIVAGQQAMTIYKPIKIEADQAGELAVALLKGTDVGTTTDYNGVKSFIFDPIVVSADNVKDTVVKDGFYKASQICTPAFAKACAEAGLQ